MATEICYLPSSSVVYGRARETVDNYIIITIIIINIIMLTIIAINVSPAADAKNLGPGSRAQQQNGAYINRARTNTRRPKTR